MTRRIPDHHQREQAEHWIDCNCVLPIGGVDRPAALKFAVAHHGRKNAAGQRRGSGRARSSPSYPRQAISGRPSRNIRITLNGDPTNTRVTSSGRSGNFYSVRLLPEVRSLQPDCRQTRASLNAAVGIQSRRFARPFSLPETCRPSMSANKPLSHAAPLPVRRCPAPAGANPGIEILLHHPRPLRSRADPPRQPSLTRLATIRRAGWRGPRRAGRESAYRSRRAAAC